MKEETRHAAGESARPVTGRGVMSGALTKSEFEVEYASAYRSLVVLASAVAGREHAEDVVSDAAIVALKKRETFQRGSNFGAWMATIVRNVGRNASRGERRRVRRLRLVARGTDTEPARDGGAPRFSPELEAMLDSLSAAQRECFLLRVALSHTYDEIAAITGIAPATARSHVLRARRRLLDLAGEGGER